MEWSQSPPMLMPTQDHNIRCFRLMGVRGHISQPLVPASVAATLNLWFLLQWLQHWAAVTIDPKELVPIVIEVALWGSHWSGSRVCSLCDNAAVVAAVNKGSARDPSLVRLLRILAFLCAVLNITVTAQHLPGVQNVVADVLSRNYSLPSILRPPQSQQ